MLNGSLQRGFVVVERPEVPECCRDVGDSQPVGFAGIERDIAEMADGRRQMSFADIGSQVFNFAGLTGTDKVPEVLATTLEFLHNLHVSVVHPAVAVRILHDIAVGAIEYDSDLVPAFALEQSVQFGVVTVIDGQSAGFKDDGAITVVIDGDFGVGGITCVDILVIPAFGLIAQTPAVAEDA